MMPQPDQPAAQEPTPTADVTVFLRRSAQVAPTAVAVAHVDGDISYRRLLNRASHVAGLLPPPAPGPEPIVVVTEHDPATPELYFGVMMAGHAVVPVSARLPASVIAQIAEAAGARLGLLAPSAAHRQRDLAETVESARWVAHPADGTWGSLPVSASTLPNGTAMVPFTSGTTGEPKGVIVTHANLIANGFTSALVFGMPAGNCQVNPFPLAHFAGASRVVLSTVHAGTHVILPEFDSALVFDAVQRWRATHLTVAPSMVPALMEAGPERFDLQSLQTLIYGTAPMPMAMAAELFGRMRCDLINGYGLTESTGLVTALDAEGHRRAVGEENNTLLGSVGRAVPGVELRILDEQHKDVAPGEFGEITLRGPKVTPGYLDDRHTAAKYLPGGWLRSGDEGRFSEAGNVALAGRLDDQMVTGGLNVQPMEIENAATLIDGVAACAAFPVPSVKWGQEIQLAIVASPGAQIDPDAVRLHLRQRLDPYKVPKAVHIVQELPRSALGKVQRRRLSEQFGAQV